MHTPSLSVCMLTRGPPARVRALLELVRPVADELVLAVDESGETSTLDACADLVDQGFALEVGLPARAIGWLLHQCTGDWILRLDDDEVPSAALLAALSSVITAEHLTSVAIERRWLHLDSRRWVAVHPWTPDYQLRLVRNLPGVWRLPGAVHDELDVVGERRLLPLPIYHLDLLLHGLDARRGKRQHYESLRPGHTVDGFPVNAMYTPEEVEGVELASVPADDVELIDRVRRQELPEAAAQAPVRHRCVSAAETEAYFSGRELRASAYKAGVRFVRPVRALAAGQSHVVELEVENRGDECWPAGEAEPAIRVVHRWIGPTGSALGAAARTLLPERLPPGETTRVLVRTTAPAWAGQHALRAGLVHEGVGFFDAAAEQPVEVRRAIDHAALGSPPPDPSGELAAEIKPSAAELSMEVGERGTFDVSARNTGTRSWDSSGRSGPPVRASCRWIDPGGTVVVTDAPRTSLTGPVEPGEEASVALDLAAPVRPGRYEIEVDLVQEGVRWFGAPVRLPVELVAPAPMRDRLAQARRAAGGPRARLRRRRAHAIPRQIHRVWLGGDPLPEEFRWYGETWARLNPGWKLRLWGDRQAARLIPAAVRGRTRSLSELSNLLRYEILRRVGGVYVDTDVECRRSFDPLLDDGDAFGAWEYPYRIGTAVLGSVPGHPVFELAAREARVTVGMGLHSAEGTGPGFLTQIVAEQPSLAVFDTELFYPYRWDQPHRRNEPFPNSFAVHHWTLSWTR